MKKNITTITILVMMFTLLFSSTISFAATNGTVINYTSTHIDEGIVKYNTKIDGKDFVGICCEVGIPSERSGTAKIEGSYGKNTILAKMLYYYGVQRGLYNGPDSDEETSVNGYKVQSKFLLLSHIAQVRLADDKATFIKHGTEWQGYSKGYCEAVWDWVQEKAGSDTIKNVTVPKWFEVYKCRALSDDGNKQDFTSFVLVPSMGDLTIKKVVTGGDDSSNQTFTFNVTVSGVSGTHSGVKFTDGKATITLKGGQSKTIEDLPKDKSYTVTETNIPSGWTLKSKANDSGKIKAGDEVIATFTNEKSNGKIILKKVSALPAITN